MNSKTNVQILIVCNCALIILVSLMAFTNLREKFTVIDAERINIVNEKGQAVMVLSNRKLMPGPSMNGKDYPKEIADGREYLSGIIFFNELGDEVGGLLYNGIKKDSSYSALGHLSFDQWKQNQVVAIQYLDNGKTRRSGLRVWDRPTNVPFDQQLDRLALLNKSKAGSSTRDSVLSELKKSQQRGENGVERLFIGSQDEIAQIQLRDKNGKVRLRLFIDKTGEPKLEFLDANGEVKDRFPGSHNK